MVFENSICDELIFITSATTFAVLLDNDVALELKTKEPVAEVVKSHLFNLNGILVSGSAFGIV